MSIDAGKKFRIVVSSAEEAVRLLRKHLGDKARVLSVKQIEGKGLARFLRTPQLEIIATIDNGESKIEAKAQSKQASESQQMARIDEQEEKNFLENSPITSTAASSSETPIISSKQVGNVLKRSGFDSVLVGEFLQKLPSSSTFALNDSLRKFLENLKKEYDALHRNSIGNRVIFMGPSGAGKTLSLCKLLAQDVFIRGIQPTVLKLDSKQPKGDEALSIFCQVLGISFLHEGIDAANDSLGTGKVYFDSDGISFHEASELQVFKEKLDRWHIDTRVLVLNGTYENEFLEHCFSKSVTLLATHCVFTHLDEVIGVSKLWKYLLKGGLTPYFFTYGQNITADFTENMFSYLLNKTFANENFIP